MKSPLNRTLILAIFICAATVTAFAQDAPLKVISVPTGVYTSEARSQMIEGWIRLRITFLATGEIGDIFYVSESDPQKSLTRNGLLKSSYEAAKKITFSPALKDGKAVTVTKVLQYDYNLGRRPTEFRQGER